jgi:hypothetical protein
MPFSINQFRQELRGQGARPNLFEVGISVLGNPAASAKMTFMTKTSQIPESTIGTVEVPYYGRVIKVMGNRTFAEFNTTVINDEDFAVHSGLVNWLTAINTHSSNMKTVPGYSYQTQGRITQYSKEGAAIKNVVLHNLWPSVVAAIPLSWDTNDTVEDFEVTWQYDYWTVNDATTDTGPTDSGGLLDRVTDIGVGAFNNVLGTAAGAVAGALSL